ncbi:hypothetical protein KP509_29G021000 [Ceratopteris richardii]|uniref:Tonoplast dicarboxylate transporter n=1 Tax=Ceratopteris richardii TaxID=49495 RepID=A0A8T2R6Y7_CERRI|nr:hypothetical protein KP509_29G021000 [Ceratopteris richardii]
MAMASRTAKDLSPSTPLLQQQDYEPAPDRPGACGRVRAAVASFLKRALKYTNWGCIVLGPLVAILVWALLDISEDSSGKAVSMIAVMCWVFIWWITEAIPIAATALTPLFLLPFTQICTASQASKAYLNDTIFLMLGSFILAIAIEHYGLHHRMAMKMLNVLGGKKMDPWALVLGFCVGPAFVSLWINNSAAAVMMMPVGLGVLQKANACIESSSFSAEEGPEAGVVDGVDGVESAEKEKLKIQMAGFSKAVVLAIGFSATIGGMGTLTGTGANLILAGLYEAAYPSADDQVTYLAWLMFGFPMALLITLFLWLMLCLWFCPRSSASAISRSLRSSNISADLASFGPMSFAEITVLVLFGILIALWLTRSFGNSGGWGELFNGYVGNGSVAVLMATLLFIIPNRRKEGEKLVDWSHCKKIPWDIILLLGGGFAIAEGMTDSGLSDVISAKMDFLKYTPYALIVPVVAIFTSIMTEFTSNNSTATIFISLVMNVAVSIGQHPLYLMVPAAIAAQYSFMLIIATPPNAVAFSSGYITTLDMLVTGFFLKVFGIVLLSIAMPTLGAAVFKTN